MTFSTFDDGKVDIVFKEPFNKFAKTIFFRRTNKSYLLHCYMKQKGPFETFEDDECTYWWNSSLFFDLFDEERRELALALNFVTNDNLCKFEKIIHNEVTSSFSFYNTVDGDLQSAIKLNEYLFFNKLDKYKFAISKIRSSVFLSYFFKNIKSIQAAYDLFLIAERNVGYDIHINRDTKKRYQVLIEDNELYEYSPEELFCLTLDIPRICKRAILDYTKGVKDVSELNTLALFGLKGWISE